MGRLLGLCSRLRLSCDSAITGHLADNLGVEIGYYVKPNFRARLSYSALKYENSRKFGSINFVEGVDQTNGRLSLDWFPSPRHGFFTSVGLAKLGDSPTLNAPANTNNNNTYTLNGVAYTGAQLGNISGTVETKKNLPYLGMGYKHSFGGKDSGLYLQAEVGAVFGLDTQLKLSSDNPENVATLNANLQSYADQQNDKFEDRFLLYGLTIGYRF